MGKKCLLIAEKVLSKGLPLKSPPTGDGTTAVNPEPTQANSAENVETASGEPTQSVEGGNNEEEEEPGVEYLSCAGVQLETTIWSTMQKAAALKGN